MNGMKESLLKKYIHLIKALESNIALFNKNDSNRIGYIISLEDFNNLKTKVQYETNKNNKNFKNTGYGKPLEIKDNEKIISIKELEFKSSQYLINMILNGNKYLIIDSTFWKAIC